MIIAIDFDDVIADPSQALEDFYHAEYDPGAVLPENAWSWSSTWEVFAGKKEKWKEFFERYTQSEYFDKGTLVPGAYEGVRELKKQGHDLFVVSSCLDDKEVTLRRKKHAERLLGTDILSDVITVSQFETKADIVEQKGASVLIDDGPMNIVDVILRGINGIWFKCAANSKMVNQVMSGASEEEFKKHFWKFDPQLLRDKAIIANNWDEVVKIISCGLPSLA